MRAFRHEWIHGAGAIMALALSAAPMRAQWPFLVEGLADGEAWSTTRHSNLLTRNDGRLAPMGRVALWGALEPVRGLVFYAQGGAEGGKVQRTGEAQFETEADLYGVRYTGWRGLWLDAGKIQQVVGTFAPRHFSNRNPLIGSPDAYSLDYPVGAVLSGASRHFDARAGMVSLPATHEGYSPDPTPRLRPAVGAGFTPVVGVRIGGSWTAGPYLNDALTAVQLADEAWTRYHQRVVALDGKVSRGYFEAYAEASRATYDVPARDRAILGYSYYGEVKYTLAPRFYLALRAERNAYPFIRASETTWIARRVDFVNGEVGAGYRAAPRTLLKLSLRGDRWRVAPGANGFLGQGGPAVALQVSQSFDVKALLTRRVE